MPLNEEDKRLFAELKGVKRSKWYPLSGVPGGRVKKAGLRYHIQTPAGRDKLRLATPERGASQDVP